MVNSRYDIPRALKRRCHDGSSELRSFYDMMFVHDYTAFRDEVDFGLLQALSSEELDVVDELVNLNLQHRHCSKAAEKVRSLKAGRA